MASILLTCPNTIHQNIYVLGSHLQKVIVMTEPLSIIKLDVVSSAQTSATVVPTKSDSDVCFVYFS